MMESEPLNTKEFPKPLRMASKGDAESSCCLQSDNII